MALTIEYLISLGFVGNREILGCVGNEALLFILAVEYSLVGEKAAEKKLETFVAVSLDIKPSTFITKLFDKFSALQLTEQSQILQLNSKWVS